MFRMASREFGALLTRQRKRAGLTQAELSRRTGIDRGQYANYESGAVDPTAGQLMKIAGALGLDVLSEAPPVDEPSWATEILVRLDRIEQAVAPESHAGIYRRVVGDANRQGQRGRAEGSL